VIALYAERALELTPDDLSLLRGIGQALAGSTWGERSAEQLARAERRYRDLIERLPVVSYLAEYGPAGKWLYVSPQIEGLLGFPAEDWLVNSDFWWSRMDPDDRDRVALEEARCAQTLEPLSVEYRMIARDGRTVWIRDEGALGRQGNSGAVRVEGVLTDITERRRIEEELRHLADHDELTGLANRRRFTDELGRRRQGSAGAVALLDLDDLKYVNDSLGHAAGDSLLRTVATMLRDALGPGELLARFGGDEFGLLLEASTVAEVRLRLAALLHVVRELESGLPARASAGAVLFERGAASTDEQLMIAADIALHEAKERGGDRYEIFEGQGPERLAWVGQVRDAIDDDRLCLHAQPIFDLLSGERMGCEVLVRMFEADGTVVPPGAFLPTAERFGLISEIDGWVVERGIELAARGAVVTINVSARSIPDPTLIPRIRTALAATGADPGQVVFELTETAMATASEDLRAFGTEIERIGCALAIDDFGTGFGSLTYLKHLPVRYLKIDMEFVAGLRSSAADRAIVESIVTIAKSLEMHTVAEGVEDAETLDCLAAIGVDYAQGYHLGRPAPVD
jgi:diguanylate cyclase (GGDEF)-like protein/PAS domain S-box-containing protein